MWSTSAGGHLIKVVNLTGFTVQGGSNMTGTDLCVNKPHCACARKCLSIMVTKKKSVPVIFEPPCTYYPKPNYYLYFCIKLVLYLVSYSIGEGIYAAFNV